MIAITTEIVGLPELGRALATLAADLQGPAIGGALEAGALPIANAAKEAAPYKTGTLRRSIHVERVSVSGAVAAVAVGTDVPYARRLEYGFSGADSLGRVFNQPARPYLRPAFDQQRAAAVAEVARVLEQLVAAAGRGRRG